MTAGTLGGLIGAPRGLAPANAAGVVGPNAIIQTFAAIRAAAGEEAARRVAEAADCAGWLDAAPAEMVDERAAARLFRALETVLPDEAPAIEAEAGRLTAGYILANRIPRPAQTLLRVLPAWLAGRLLLAAIGRNAWTFAGSGSFRGTANGGPGRVARVEIGGNPLTAGSVSPAPACRWHGAVFRRLFRELVDPRTEVRETACCASGAPACVFEISRGGGR